MQNHIRQSDAVKSSQNPSNPPDIPVDPKRDRWFLRAFADSILDASVIDLSDRARFVLMVLDARAGTDPFCYPGNGWLREKTGKSDATLREIFAELEEQGWFVRVFSDPRKRDRIGFVFLRRLDPQISPSAKATETGIEAATKKMLAKIASHVAGNPATSGKTSPDSRRSDRRKIGDHVAGFPLPNVAGKSATYKESVVIVETEKKDSGIERAEEVSLSNDDDQRSEAESTPVSMEEPQVVVELPKLEAFTPLMEVLGRVMQDVRQAASMADEPINGGSAILPPGIRRFLSDIGPERQSKLLSVSPDKRRELLVPHVEDFNDGLFEFQLRQIDSIKTSSAVLSPATLTTEDLIISVADGRAEDTSRLAESLCQDFGHPEDRVRWGALLALAQQLYKGDVSPEDVLDSHRQAMGPDAKNPGAVFTTALKRHGWRPR